MRLKTWANDHLGGHVEEVFVQCEAIRAIRFRPEKRDTGSGEILTDAAAIVFLGDDLHFEVRDLISINRLLDMEGK